MKLSYGWVIVAVGALMTCVAIGSMFSLAVYLQPMSIETGWARARISSAMTLHFITIGIAALRLGPVRHRLAPPPVVPSPGAGPGRRPSGESAAIPGAGLDFRRLLRGAFRADLPHGELCDRVRHTGDGGRQHL